MNDNFKCIYKILRTLEKAMDFQEYDFECIGYKALEISKERWERYIEMMCDAGYIKGVRIKEYIDGDKLFDVSEMRITLKGLEYLSENSVMQRLYNTTMGIKNIIS